MATKIFVSQIDTANSIGSTTPDGTFIQANSSGGAYWSSQSLDDILSAYVPTGYTGSTGDDGITGYTGSRGPDGYFGSTGFIGSKGTIGDLGVTGYTGSIGNTGYQGSAGIGGTGYTGSLGTTGYTGSVGFFGSEGPVGPRGDLGYQGSEGYRGSLGATGYTGSIGTTGYTGSTSGVIGPTGFTGSVGDTGYKGSVGFLGSVGFFGSVGYRGSVGTTGTLAFVNLTDVPASYSGQSNRFVRVNGAGTGLYFDSNTYVTNAFGTSVNFNSNTVYAPALQHYSEKINVIGNSGLEKLISLQNGNLVTITLNQAIVDIVLLQDGLVSGQSHTITLALKQDASGNRSVDWSNQTIYWPRGEGIYSPDGPTLSTEANYTDFITLMTFDAGGSWFGVISAKGFPTT